MAYTVGQVCIASHKRNAEQYNKDPPGPAYGRGYFEPRSASELQ